MRFLTLSFDDGFRASTVKTADLFEQYGLRAEFNVVVTYGERDPQKFGDWELWNELAARGHRIQPHGYSHMNKSSMPFEVARDSIQRCLDAFAENLSGFDAHQTVFAFPYNASTPELEAWLPSVVRAFRGSGPTLNPLPGKDTVKLTCGGWEDAEPWLDRTVEQLLEQEEGWAIYCAHALDGEGWGPLRTNYLEQLLERLTQVEHLEILPSQEVFEKVVGPK